MRHFLKLINISFLSIIMLLGVTVSCKKDTVTPNTITVIEHDTLKYAWNQVDVTSGIVDQRFDNSFVYNGKAIFTLNGGGAIMYDSAKANHWSMSDSYIVGPSINRVAVGATPIYKNFYIEVTQDAFEINNNPYITGGVRRKFNFKDLDTSLKHLGMVGYDLLGADINDAGRAIFPVSKSYGPLVGNAFLLLDITPNGSGYFDTLNRRYVHAGYINESYGLRVGGHIKNSFFVGSNDSTFIVRPNYSVSGVADGHLKSFFFFNGNYWAIDGKFNGLYQSIDFGETWQMKFNISSPNQTTIINFNNTLVAFINNQLFEVIITPTSIAFNELVNSGLQGRLISSITTCNGSAFITTNEGLYTRSLSDFFQYK